MEDQLSLVSIETYSYVPASRDQKVVLNSFEISFEIVSGAIYGS